jgi:PIN domain nuclease of toxin-antitoxin system
VNRFLVDSNVVIRMIFESERISMRVRNILEEGGHDFYFSAAVPWELSIKAGLGKLGHDIRNAYYELLKMGWIELPIEGVDGLNAGALPRHHGDPFDRIMIAQAQRHDLTVLTADADFDPYDVKVVRG